MNEHHILEMAHINIWCSAYNTSKWSASEDPVKQNITIIGMWNGTMATIMKTYSEQCSMV